MEQLTMKGIIIITALDFLQRLYLRNESVFVMRLCHLIV